MSEVECDLVMMIHDEMVWQVNTHHVTQAATIVRNSLEFCGQVISSQGPKRKLDMKVKLSAGPSWGNLSQLTI